jgi:hypothetical protein
MVCWLYIVNFVTLPGRPASALQFSSYAPPGTMSQRAVHLVLRLLYEYSPLFARLELMQKAG